jgi:hypothetical protein
LADNDIYNNKISRLLGLFIVLIFYVPIKLHAQDEQSIRPIIEAGDLKKLIKADEYLKDADDLIEEASRLNMEVFTVQADPNLDEKAIQKKTGQLESQAQQKQVQASGLYEKCNEIKFTVYRKYLDEFWKDHTGEESNYLNSKLLEEQASDNYFQAASYRIEAKKMEAGFAKVEKLTEAGNLELQAIQKQLTALGDYYKISATPAREVPAEVVQPTVTGRVPAEKDNIPETTIPGQVELDTAMMGKYNRYISSGHFSDTSLSTGEIAGVTTFDADQLLQLWYDYMYGKGALDAGYSLADEKDTLQMGAETGPAAQAALTDTSNAEIGVITDENVGRMIPADEEVIFRVQLAANRSELSQRALSRMYYGNKAVEMINENGWYKYSVGDFDTYKEASEFRKSTGLRDAFVVAYRKGTRFAPGASPVEITAPTEYAPAGEQRMPPGLLFRIQVAASRIPLNLQQLKRIYSGKYPIEMIFEEGWYKYQFMGIRLYSDALHLKQNLTTPGAFIVAYENGTKANMADAVKKSRELEIIVQSKGRKGNIDEIEFHLQLAASRLVMSQEELQAIYNGPEPVSVILEDGWYKYHLKAGSSPEMAEQFKQSCGIAGAFIVPYKRAAKIPYYEAIQEMK